MAVAAELNKSWGYNLLDKVNSAESMVSDSNPAKLHSRLFVASRWVVYEWTAIDIDEMNATTRFGALPVLV